MAEEFRISDWLQKAKEDPKEFATPLILVLGVFFVVWKFLYSPKAVMIDKEIKKNKRLVAEMRNFKSATNQIEDIKINIEEKKKKWEKTQKLCYKELDRTDFLKKIRELANKADISVKSIKPSPDENIKLGAIEAKKFSVHFSYSGDLTRLLTFMRLIELEDKICFMSIPELSPTASGTFDTELNISTILLPDSITAEVPAAEGGEEEEEDY